jgi:hypothetical protein
MEPSIKSRSLSSSVSVWRSDLARLLDFYERRRGRIRAFFPKLFLFFFLLNVACYWWALATAFPERAFGSLGRAQWVSDFILQFPVGFLGALFDSLSFFVTILIIRQALNASTTTGYIVHLSIDLIIAVGATFWVIFVFWVSGLLLDLHDLAAGDMATSADILAQQNQQYRQLLANAIQSPADAESVKNIYFGIVMGISAMLPTFTHILLCSKSAITVMARRAVQ